MCACVCVCVRERERERERACVFVYKRESGQNKKEKCTDGNLFNNSYFVHP